METWSLLLLKSVVVSGLLTGWYILGLRGRRLHHYNRFFLLTTLLVSLIIPFLHFNIFSLPHVDRGGLAPVALLVAGPANEGINTPEVVQQVVVSQVNWQAVAGFGVASLSVILLLILFVRIWKVTRMTRQYPTRQFAGVRILLTDSASAPFAFLKYLFWNKSIPLDGEVGQLILKHELTHIRQGHTYDKLFCQLLTCLFWFNPFYWLIQKELNLVHEFLADEEAVENRNTEKFALMLLQTYNNGSFLAPQHHFFASSVKRRLSMLQNVAQPKFAALRQFIALPLIAGSVLLFSFGYSSEPNISIAAAKNKIVVLLDAGHGGKDAGAKKGNYVEKDICLKVAHRLKELAPNYNIEVQLTRDNDFFLPLNDRLKLSDKLHPDVFISLHVGTEAGKVPGKGDYDMLVSGQNALSAPGAIYSNAILQAMVREGIIAGSHLGCSHDPNTMCSNCKQQMLQGNMQQQKLASTENDGIFLLKHANSPAMMMVLGDINNQTAMQQFSDDKHLDELSNTILKGIVDGAASFTTNNTNTIKSILDFKNDTPKNNAGGSLCK